MSKIRSEINTGLWCFQNKWELGKNRSNHDVSDLHFGNSVL